MNGDVIPYFCDRTRGVETKLKKINFYRKSWSRMTVSVYKTKIKKKKKRRNFSFEGLLSGKRTWSRFIESLARSISRRSDSTRPTQSVSIISLTLGVRSVRMEGFSRILIINGRQKIMKDKLIPRPHTLRTRFHSSTQRIREQPPIQVINQRIFYLVGITLFAASENLFHQRSFIGNFPRRSRKKLASSIARKIREKG